MSSSKTRQTPPLGYRVNRAAYLLCIARSSVYRLVDAGELELVKVGLRSSIITRASLLKFAESRGIAVPCEL